MRTKKATLNILFDFVPQLLIIIIAFFRSKIFLNCLGSDNVGLYNYLNQIIAYLSLAELGLTSAVLYYLYAPIRNHDVEKIKSILKAASFVFKIIMISMLILGFIISPLLPHFIKNLQFSDIYVILIFIIILFTNALTYLSTPFVILFDAHQEKYKYIFIFQSLIILRNLASIALVLLYKNLFLVVILECIITIAQNIIIRILYKKNYKHLEFKSTEKKDFSFMKKIKALIPHRIGYVVSQNIDIVLVTSFLGLTQVAVYTCYNYIVNCLNVLIGRISSATLPSIGDLIVEKKEKSYDFFLEYNNLLNFFAIIVVCPLFIIFNNFIGIWYGKEYVLSIYCAFIFSAILYYNIIRINLTTFASGAGLFKETLICVWLEVILNLIISIFTIKYLGIFGLIFGTLCSMLLGEFLINPFILNKYIFKNKIVTYYLNCLLFLIFLVINTVLIEIVCSSIRINNIYALILEAVVIFIVNLGITLGEFKIFNKLSFFNRFIKLKRK